MTPDELQQALDQLARERKLTTAVPRAEIWDELQTRPPFTSRGRWMGRRSIIGVLAIAASLLVVASGIDIGWRARHHHTVVPEPMSLAARAVISRHLARSDSMVRVFRDASGRGVWTDSLTVRARELELATRRIQGERMTADSVTVGLLADVDFVLTEITGYGDLTTTRGTESEMIDYSIQVRQVAPRLERVERLGMAPASDRAGGGVLKRLPTGARALRASTLKAGNLVARALVAAAGAFTPTAVHAAALLSDRSADSLYRAARASLAQREYHAAADLFTRAVSGDPGAGVAGNALYWRAYALYASGLARSDSTDLRGALEALHSEESIYPRASTAREGRSLLGRVIVAQAELGDIAAIHALDAATRALGRPFSCDDQNVDLELVALERLVDREHENAMPAIQRVLATSGRCTEEVRQVAVIVIINTPAMDGMADLVPTNHALHDVDAGATETLIPIRPLGPIIARSKESFKSILQIRPLSDGRLLANDPQGRRLVLLDSSLATALVVASDTTAGIGPPVGGLFAYYGDSSLFSDAASMSMRVIDPDGKITRAFPAPGGDLGRLGYATIPSYGAAFDGLGHVVSVWPARKSGGGGGNLAGTAPGSAQFITAFPARDTQPIVRIDLVTKKADTVAWLVGPPPGTSGVIALLGVGGGAGRSTGGGGGGGRWISAGVTPLGGGATIFSSTFVGNPMPVSDDWAVLSDGTIAVVRGAVFRVDWIAPNGTQRSSPPIRRGRERVTDSLKVAIVDSLRTVDSLNRAKMLARVDSLAAISKDPPPIIHNTPFSLKPSDLPDYFPPFLGIGNVKVDAEGDLWIRVSQLKPLDGGPVYDVVNRSGALIDRVQIPSGMTIMGFGPGVIYLTSREGTVVSLVRARIR